MVNGSRAASSSDSDVPRLDADFLELRCVPRRLLRLLDDRLSASTCQSVNSSRDIRSKRPPILSSSCSVVIMLLPDELDRAYPLLLDSIELVVISGHYLSANSQGKGQAEAIGK